MEKKSGRQIAGKNLQMDKTEDREKQNTERKMESEEKGNQTYTNMKEKNKKRAKYATPNTVGKPMKIDEH